ncbi:MAG: hypothetical protein ABIJ28_00575 [Patescibacteria group bacterium]
MLDTECLTKWRRIKINPRKIKKAGIAQPKSKKDLISTPIKNPEMRVTKILCIN